MGTIPLNQLRRKSSHLFTRGVRMKRVRTLGRTVATAATIRVARGCCASDKGVPLWLGNKGTTWTLKVFVKRVERGRLATHVVRLDRTRRVYTELALWIPSEYQRPRKNNSQAQIARTLIFECFKFSTNIQSIYRR